MYHSEEEEQIRDVVRADIIRSKDNTVIPVHKMDLYDLNNHYTLLQDLIGTMDLKLRIRARNFALGFEQIRSLLPRWHSQSWEPSTQAIHRKIRYLISQRERGELLPKPRRRDKVLRRALEIIDFYDQMKVPMNRQHGYCESIDFNVIWAA